MGWVVLFYFVPLMLLLHYVLDGRLELPQWLLHLNRFALSDTILLGLGAGTFVLVMLTVQILKFYIEQRGQSEDETRNLWLSLTDNTGVVHLDRWLLFGTLGGVAVLMLLRMSGAVEALLAGGILIGIGLGSRPLPRFLKEPEKTLMAYHREKFEALSNRNESDAVVRVEYRWLFREHTYLSRSSVKMFSFTIPFDTHHYNQALAKDHSVSREQDYARFVHEDLQTDEVVMVAAKLQQIHAEQRYTRFQQVCNVLAFSEQFRYVREERTQEVRRIPRYPVETLWQREGDGESLAILVSALLKLLGFELLLLVLDWEQEAERLAIAVAGADDLPAEMPFYEFEGKRYFYCEAILPPNSTSAEPGAWSWRIGVLPFDDLYRIRSVPLMVSTTPSS